MEPADSQNCWADSRLQNQRPGDADFAFVIEGSRGKLKIFPAFLVKPAVEKAAGSESRVVQKPKRAVTRSFSGL